MSIESVIPSSHLILCHPLLLLPPTPPSGQSTGVSALASFLPKKSQGWSPSEWTGWITLQSKGFSRVLSNTRFQKHQFYGAQPSSQSNSHIQTWSQEKTKLWLDGPLLAEWCLCFLICCLGLSAFLPRSKHLLISWLQSPSAVTLETPKIKSLTIYSMLKEYL